MKRRLIIVVLLATGLGWLMLRGMPHDSGIASPQAMPSAANQDGHVATKLIETFDRTRGAAASTAGRDSLNSGSGPTAPIGPPPANAPAATQIRYWREAARSGHAYAQCQYARYARRCQTLLSGHTSWASARRESEMAAALDAGRGTVCRGIGFTELDPAFDVLHRSSQQGLVSAQVMFAAGWGLSPWGDVRHPERLIAYRAEAPQLAWRAFAAGDSDAAMLLWRAYNHVQTDFLYLAGAIDPDPVKAHALDLLMDDLVPDIVVGTAAEAGLSKAQAARAEALHAEWRSTAFAHGKPPRYGLEIERMLDDEHPEVDLCRSDSR
jgi:TPR repeat protein